MAKTTVIKSYAQIGYSKSLPRDDNPKWVWSGSLDPF